MRDSTGLRSCAYRHPKAAQLGGNSDGQTRKTAAGQESQRPVVVDAMAGRCLGRGHGRQLCVAGPYYLHFYGRFGTSPGGLTVPLLLTLVWFLVATVLLVTRRRGGVPVMASFLVVEALFYLVHNVSGAAGRDLPAGDIVLLVASLLGDLNALAAVLVLGWLFVTRRRTRPGDRRTINSR